MWNVGLSNSGGGGRALRPPRACPSDCSPDGVFDLAGNVSEWTATRHETPQAPDGRVVRGSAFAMFARFELFLLEHLATRKTIGADARKEYLGFRCAKDVSR